MRRAINHTRAANPIVWLAALGIIGLAVFVIALTAWFHNANTRNCHNQGGTVVVDHDTERHYNKRTARWETRTDTEHECIINGREVNEW